MRRYIGYEHGDMLCVIHLHGQIYAPTEVMLGAINIRLDP